MPFEASGDETVRPFLTRFAVPRSSPTKLPGRYSSELDLWVVEGRDGLMPFVSQASSDLVTRTRVQGEQTDCADDMGTHTSVAQEQDDKTKEVIFASMATITEVGGEQLDQCNHVAWLQMATVTKVGGEASDAVPTRLE